jgi:hypothetical protein
MPAKSLSSTITGLFPELPLSADESQATRVTSPRSHNRAHWWRHELERTRAYLYGQAKSEAEQEQIDRVYEDALAEGPDFTNYRRDSVFAEAPRLKIDRNTYARIIFALDAIERGTYRHSRAKGAQGVPRTAARVLKALLGLALRYGRVCPSLEGLAGLACVCKQTVVNCLKFLELYGFVVVQRRIQRIRTALGFKTVQATNSYVIQEPGGLGAMALSIFKKASESKIRSASSFHSFTTKHEPPNSPPWGIPDGVFTQLYAEWEASS